MVATGTKPDKKAQSPSQPSTDARSVKTPEPSEPENTDRALVNQNNNAVALQTNAIADLSRGSTGMHGKLFGALGTAFIVYMSTMHILYTSETRPNPYKSNDVEWASLIHIPFWFRWYTISIEFVIFVAIVIFCNVYQVHKQQCSQQLATRRVMNSVGSMCLAIGIGIVLAQHFGSVQARFWITATEFGGIGLGMYIVLIIISSRLSSILYT